MVGQGNGQDSGFSCQSSWGSILRSCERSRHRPWQRNTAQRNGRGTKIPLPQHSFANGLGSARKGPGTSRRQRNGGAREWTRARIVLPSRNGIDSAILEGTEHRRMPSPSRPFACFVVSIAGPRSASHHPLNTAVPLDLARIDTRHLRAIPLTRLSGASRAVRRGRRRADPLPRSGLRDRAGSWRGARSRCSARRAASSSR
jgi:hypothetical protein